MINNMYDDYDNKHFCYYTTSTFDNRIRPYLINKNILGLDEDDIIIYVDRGNENFNEGNILCSL